MKTFTSLPQPSLGDVAVLGLPARIAATIENKEFLQSTIKLTGLMYSGDTTRICWIKAKK